MKDWKAIARGLDLGIPEEDLARVVKPLESLEEAFRPLMQELTPDLEPLNHICPPGQHE